MRYMENEHKTTYSNFEAAIKAKELFDPIEDEDRKKRKEVFGNVATIISTLAIFLTIVLFSYNIGYSSVYNIPVKCVPLDLKSYIPVTISVCGMMSYFFWYYALIKTDFALKKRKINVLRIIYGMIILYYLLKIIHIDYYTGKIWLLFVSISFSLILEVIVFLAKRPRKRKNISKTEYDIKVEDYLINRFLFSHFVKTGICFICITVLLAPSLGRLSARANNEYQTCLFNNEQYSVIVDYGDQVLIQRAKENNNMLTICISDYTFISKNNIQFVYKQYDSVELATDF